MSDQPVDEDGEDREITRWEASIIQNDAVSRNDVLTWVITERTSDFPDKFIARPWSARHGVQHCHLAADTLDEIRELLPAGLTCMPRDQMDPLVVVESWI